MKTFRLIGVGLLAIVLCFTFSSCSDDDDEDGGNNLIVGWWQRWANVKMHMKKDGTFDYYYQNPSNPNAPYRKFESDSGTWSYNEKNQVWAEHLNRGVNFSYIIHILNEHTFSMTDLDDGDSETWTRIKE